MVDSNTTSVPVTRQFDRATEKPSSALIGAIADIHGVDAVELEIPLHDYVDPEAMDAVLTGDNPVTVSFPVDGYYVSVDGDELTITER
jgi:predicted transcriptional regulator